MAERKRCVIVGGGQAAAQAAVSLRQNGFTGAVSVICDEPFIPYQRPPLSKRYLAGEAVLDDLFLRPATLYEKLEIRVRAGVRVAELDREKRELVLADGEAKPYDTLVLATGSRPRRLEVAGSEPAGVVYLRTLADADAVRSRFSPGTRLVVIGGGYIGLEVAAIGSRCGLSVTVLESAERVLGRVTGPEIARALTEIHRGNGVQIVTGASVTSIDRDQSGASRIACADGLEFFADVVLVAIGIVPNVELAECAGLACDNGIVVDEYGRTGDPAILAAGDCTNHPNPLLARRLRLESVHNAIEQAKTVAATVVGSPKQYAQVPWFWSDQYQHKLQTVGLAGAYDRVVIHESPEQPSLTAIYLAGPSVTAVDSLDAPGDFVFARSLFRKQEQGGPGPTLNDWSSTGRRAAS